MRRTLIALMIVIGVLVFNGCGEKAAEVDQQTGAPLFNINTDLPYKISTTKISGSRTLAISFTNNTDYDIVTWYMEFTVPEKTSKKTDNVIMQGTQTAYTATGKETRKFGLYDEKWNDIPTTDDISKMIEPDSLTIEYRYKDELYATTYDYVSKDTTYSNRDGEKFGV